MNRSTMWPLEDSAKSEHIIAGKTIATHKQELIDERITLITEDAWLSAEDQQAMLNLSEGCVLLDQQGRKLATYGDTSKELIANSSFLVEFPWHILNISEQIISSMTESMIEGDVSDLARIDGFITLGKGSKLLPGVYIEGNVTIGENCKIGPNCYIRGNTSIADKVHIGQSVEVKNSIIGHKTAVGHLSYIGDSIVGDFANFGAGTIVSNFRHDGGNHWSLVNHQKVDTGRRKFGAVIGDHVHTGINTAIYPGRKLEAKSSTHPGGIVSEDHHA